LCNGLDPKFVDPVPVTQKVIEGFYNGCPNCGFKFAQEYIRIFLGDMPHAP